MDKRSATGTELFINAQAGQISRQVTRTIRVELDGDGAAPVQVTLTVEVNNTVEGGTVGDS